jgi:hypothetical protein
MSYPKFTYMVYLSFLTYFSLGSQFSICGIRVYPGPGNLTGSDIKWNVNLIISVDGKQEDSFYENPPSSGDPDSPLLWSDFAFIYKFDLPDTRHTVRVDVVPPSQFIVGISSPLCLRSMGSYSDFYAFLVRLPHLLHRGRSSGKFCSRL